MSSIIIGSIINAVVLQKQLCNIDGVSCIAFKFIGNEFKIIFYD